LYQPKPDIQLSILGYDCDPRHKIGYGSSGIQEQEFDVADPSIQTCIIEPLPGQPTPPFGQRGKYWDYVAHAVHSTVDDKYKHGAAHTGGYNYKPCETECGDLIVTKQLTLTGTYCKINKEDSRIYKCVSAKRPKPKQPKLPELDTVTLH